MIKIRKIALLSTILMGMSFMTPSQAANQEQEPPLRMAPDRSQLIDMLSDEQLLRKIKPFDESSADKLKKAQLETQKIKETAPHDPEMLYRIIPVNHKDPVKKQVGKEIYLSPDYTSTIMFMDRDGKKWPIKNYTLSLGEKVIHSVIDTGTIIFQPRQQFAKGNLVVMLKGSDMPVTMTVRVSPEKVDFQTKVRIDDFGPYSKPEFSGGDGSSYSTNNLSSMAKFTKSDMLLLLQGYKPDDTYKVKSVNDNNLQVWAKDKLMFVRTEDEMISPNLVNNENNKVSDVNGTKVYVIPYTPSLVLLRQGRYVELNVK